MRTGWVLGPCRGQGRGLGAPRPCRCAPSTVHCASITPSPGAHLTPLWSRPSSACGLPTAGRPLSPGQPLGLCPVAWTHHPPKEPAEGPPQAWTSGQMRPLPSARSLPPSSGPPWPLHTPPASAKGPARPGGAQPARPLSTSWLHETLRSRTSLPHPQEPRSRVRKGYGTPDIGTGSRWPCWLMLTRASSPNQGGDPTGVGRGPRVCARSPAPLRPAVRACPRPFSPVSRPWDEVMPSRVGGTALGWSAAVQGRGDSAVGCSRMLPKGFERPRAAFLQPGDLLHTLVTGEAASLLLASSRAGLPPLCLGPGFPRPLHPTHILTDLPVAIRTAGLEPPSLKWAGPMGPGGDG